MEPVIPDFAGKVIALAKIDYGLFLWTADNWEILLAGPVVVTGGGAPPREIDVDTPGSPLPPELDGVVGAAITQLLIADNGDLSIQLGDRQLGVHAADDYEAWQIAGQDGELLICAPGGGRTYFPPVPGIGTPRGTEPGRPEDTPSPSAS
jgi:Family of unknown function (DUF6188)